MLRDVVMPQLMSDSEPLSRRAWSVSVVDITQDGPQSISEGQEPVKSSNTIALSYYGDAFLFTDPQWADSATLAELICNVIAEFKQLRFSLWRQFWLHWLSLFWFA